MSLVQWTSKSLSHLTKGLAAKGHSIKKSALAEILHAVRDDDAEVRLRATAALGRIGVGTPDVLAALVAKLTSDETPPARRTAGQALADLGAAAEPAAPRLLRLLREDHDAEVRRRAVWALARMPDALRPTIVRAFEAVLTESAAEQRLVRYEAATYLARLLGRRTPERALDVLLEMLRDDQLAVSPGGATLAAEDGRVLATEALMRVGPRLKQHTGILRALHSAAEAKDPRLRGAALQALERLGE